MFPVWFLGGVKFDAMEGWFGNVHIVVEHTINLGLSLRFAILL